MAFLSLRYACVLLVIVVLPPFAGEMNIRSLFIQHTVRGFTK